MTDRRTAPPVTVPFRVLTAAFVTVLVTVLAGCGAGRGPGVASAVSPGDTGVTTVDADEQASRYAACLQAEGVVMRASAEGRQQVDKERTSVEVMSKASEACRQHQPVETEGDRPSADDVERLRRHARCIREQGIPDYPDPDPATGEVPMSDALAARLKGDPKLVAALEACRDSEPQGDGVAVNGG